MGVECIISDMLAPQLMLLAMCYMCCVLLSSRVLLPKSMLPVSAYSLPAASRQSVDPKSLQPVSAYSRPAASYRHPTLTRNTEYQVHSPSSEEISLRLDTPAILYPLAATNGLPLVLHPGAVLSIQVPSVPVHATQINKPFRTVPVGADRFLTAYSGILLWCRAWFPDRYLLASIRGSRLELCSAPHSDAEHFNTRIITAVRGNPNETISIYLSAAYPDGIPLKFSVLQPSEVTTTPTTDQDIVSTLIRYSKDYQYGLKGLPIGGWAWEHMVYTAVIS